ncbi:hypothetical protein [Streptomyces sp. NPDC101393]|uniref:hypothetical protein n=1 Tax=Streptomyces sp. NPDC101393 TaxID=3366141 RepID=UPI00381D8449
MSTAGIYEHPPIYERLVKERGDVLAETREVAAQMEHRTRQALDWNSLRPLPPRNLGEAPADSAFG